MIASGTDRYGAVRSPLFASVLLLQSPPVLPDDVQLSQFAPPRGGIFRPNNFPNIFPGALGSSVDYFRVCSCFILCVTAVSRKISPVAAIWCL